MNPSQTARLNLAPLFAKLAYSPTASIQLDLSNMSKIMTDATLLALDTTLDPARPDAVDQRELAALRETQDLDLSNNPGLSLVGLCGLAFLKKTLIKLDLSWTAVDDLGAEKIPELFPELRHLWIFGLPITDKGLESLAAMPQLEELGIGGYDDQSSPITADGLWCFVENCISLNKLTIGGKGGWTDLDLTLIDQSNHHLHIEW